MVFEDVTMVFEACSLPLLLWLWISQSPVASGPMCRHLAVRLPQASVYERAVLISDVCQMTYMQENLGMNCWVISKYGQSSFHG